MYLEDLEQIDKSPSKCRQTSRDPETRAKTRSVSEVRWYGVCESAWGSSFGEGKVFLRGKAFYKAKSSDWELQGSLMLAF
jgi:hypothetical protein